MKIRNVKENWKRIDKDSFHAKVRHMGSNLARVHASSPPGIRNGTTFYPSTCNFLIDGDAPQSRTVLPVHVNLSPAVTSAFFNRQPPWGNGRSKKIKKSKQRHPLPQVNLCAFVTLTKKANCYLWSFFSTTLHAPVGLEFFWDLMLGTIRRYTKPFPKLSPDIVQMSKVNFLNTAIIQQ